MSWDKKMDYIYKNKDEVKCVGTIRSIETFAYYSFDIVIDNRSDVVTAKCNNYVLSNIFFPICSCVMMQNSPAMPAISANIAF